LPAFTTDTITPKYHGALVAWQKRNFPELDFLERHWSKYYPQTHYGLFAKVGKLASDTIHYGRFTGRARFERAGEMSGNMFYTARDIIRVQASTEMGALQQHRLTLDEAPTDAMKMATLRIMAEELRHGYQMFWVLDHDASWKKPGHNDVAHQVMDELLAMEVGSHVLDAFNIPFHDFLDNVVFVTFIDLVGKYQLEIQKVFSYAPMARSMGPMLSEEAFHIGSGRAFLRELAVAATNGTGRYSLDDMQRTLNAWIPRGVELFGNESGGETSMQFGFKDRNNGVAQSEYYEEVRQIIAAVNTEIVRAKVPGISAADARAIATRVRDGGETVSGVSPSDLLFVPDIKFFRARGAGGVVFKPYDVDGRLLGVDGAGYLAYLRGVLPEWYVATGEFAKYERSLVAVRH
jgi:1,2-phenylacetyl-CoA epoxidase catalytic subunit